MRTEARTEDPRDPRDSRDSDVRTGPAPEAVRTPDARSLRGDLDRIVLKAVAWDPEQRYDSAAALADDLERFLAGEPVLAVGPSTSYRVRRFVSRHAIACGLGSAAVLAMLAGTALAMAGRAQAIDAGRRAADEARRATFVSRYFLEDMLAAADPDAAAGRDVTVAELLDVAARSAEPRFAGSPDLLADVASRIGAAYARVGRAVDAVPVLEAARVAEARIEIPDPERRLRIAFELADALSQHPERHAEGVALMRDVRTEAEAVLGPAHELSMQAWVADDVAGENDVADAVVRLLEIRRELEAQGLADSPTALRAAERLSVALGWLERRDEQVAVLRELVDLAGRRLGPVHSRTFTALHRLGMALIEQGEVDRGEAMVDDAHARASSIWPDSNPNLLGMRGEVISLKLALGHTADAVELARLAARGAEEHDGEGSIRHAMAMHRLAQAMVSDGQTDEAIQILEAILPLRRQQWGPDHPQVGTTLWVLAKAYADRERWEDAWMTAEAAIPRNRPNSMGRVESLVVRARALEAMGRPGEALDGLHAALDEARAAGHERLAVRLAEVLETFPSGG